MYKDKTEIDWVVDELLMVGGLSIISADPKAGKSTVARQLVKEVLRGGTMFGRKCRKGAVMYFGMEEHTQVLNKSFNRLGIKEEDPLLIHVGDVLTDDAFNDFRETLIELKPVLVVVDTMMDLIQVESENNYGEMKTKLRKLRQVARDSGTHILCVHHNNKSGGDNDKRRGNQRILGSQAISGGMDAILVIELEGKTRYITSSGREVKQWHRQPLEFDYPSFTYTLGVKKQDEY
jgi:RecA-family ATPase